ncbi:hypothetical protein NDU88_004167 [Pleurodeles waltl]|uniref:Uncharacterized protein n=1 Tax=Pleurodeles waltl TaxID=8319 RepID=A0AAV7T806_PLEWA|nr:hypothetical protein NDU88_004167 [Pleurodeles waltl]
MPGDKGAGTHISGTQGEWHKPTRYWGDQEEDKMQSMQVKRFLGKLEDYGGPELDSDPQDLLGRARKLVARSGKIWVSNQVPGALQKDNTEPHDRATGASNRRAGRPQRQREACSWTVGTRAKGEEQAESTATRKETPVTHFNHGGQCNQL